MSSYRVNPIGGSGGFKVHVTDCTGGLRVVGIFPTEDGANAWIEADSRMARPADCDDSSLLLRQE